MRINPITNGSLLPGRQHLGRVGIVKTLLVLFLILTLEKISSEYKSRFYSLDDTHIISCFREWVRMVRVSLDGNLLASCSNDQTVRVWQAGGMSIPSSRQYFILFSQARMSRWRCGTMITLWSVWPGHRRSPLRPSTRPQGTQQEETTKTGRC